MVWLLRSIILFIYRFEQQGYVDREIWEMMGAAGMLGVAAPAEMGGVGADFKCAAIVSEEQ